MKNSRKFKQNLRQKICRSRKSIPSVTNFESVTDGSTLESSNTISNHSSPSIPSPYDEKTLRQRPLTTPSPSSTLFKPIPRSTPSPASERTRACNTRKHLPKNTELKCRTIIRLFVHALTSPATKSTMNTLLKDNTKFKKAMQSVLNDLSSERIEVNKTMRQLYALRSKGKKKFAILAQKAKLVRNKYSLRQIESVTGMTYRQIYRIVNPPKSTGGKRNVSNTDRLSIYKVVLKTIHSMQIPYRRFAKYFYLRESIKQTYKSYVREQTDLGLRILSESSFYKNLPKNVRSQKYIPFMECLCVKCLNCSLLIDALVAAGVFVQNRSIMNIIPTICPFLVKREELQKVGCDIHSEMPEVNKPLKQTSIKFCTVEEVQFDETSLKYSSKSTRNISNDVLKHKKDTRGMVIVCTENAPENLPVQTVVTNANSTCMFRECNNCGISKLFAKIHSDNPDLPLHYNKSVIWNKWCSYKDTVNGKEILRPFNKYRFQGTLDQLLDLFYNAIFQMSKHLFHFKWQAMQYEVLRDTIQEGEVGAVMDFGQNINHRKQQEAQSSHYNRRQSTIFPLICFFPCDWCPSLVTHEICCISDDLKHDAFAVRAYEQEAIKMLKADGLNIQKLYEWSDNCALEFKSKLPFELLSRMNVQINRSYWGENHGKGPADAVIGYISQFIRSAIARGKTSISHGMDMVLYLQAHLGTPTYNPDDCQCQHYRRSFAYIDSIDRSEYIPTIKTLKGTRDIHCIENTYNPGQIQVRRSTCMCR